jgi:hypothetical protein
MNRPYSAPKLFIEKWLNHQNGFALVPSIKILVGKRFMGIRCTSYYDETKFEIRSNWGKASANFHGNKSLGNWRISNFGFEKSGLGRVR